MEVFCFVGLITTLMVVSRVTGFVDTYGRRFVFPVPKCDVEYRPYLLVTSARKGLNIELIVSGLFTEIIRTNIGQFTRFELPCRKLKTSGITHSGAISVISSHDVMLHVTYQYDNFIVYSVASLGFNYSVFLTRLPNQSFTSDTSVAIATVSKHTNIKIGIRTPTSFVRFGERYIGNGGIMEIVLNETDVAVVTCFRKMCNLHIEGSEPFFVLVWNTIKENEHRISIEQIRPNNTWSDTYILPLPDWADDQVRISINTGQTNGSIISCRTQGSQKQIYIGSQSHIVTVITASEYIHLSAISSFHVMFLIKDVTSVNDTFSLISGVPIGQYLPMTCDVIKGQRGLTTIVYEEFVEETFTTDNDNCSDMYTNYSSRVNFTVVENSPNSHGVPQLAIPFLKQVLGAYTVFRYGNDVNGREQLVSGGSKLQRSYDACVDVNGTIFNNTLCLGQILTEISESNEADPDAESELFSFIGCLEEGKKRHVTWTRGSLKERGMTASVIAVIISIVVAVIGVIGFIIGLVIIDLTDDQRPMRQTRVMPIEDEPPPPE